MQDNIFAEYLWPVHREGSQYITTALGEYRTDPNRFHTGIDINAIAGTSVYPSHTGSFYKRVNLQDPQNDYVIIYGTSIDDKSTRYMHIVPESSFNDECIIDSTDIEIGKICDYKPTGSVSGDHLHFEIYIDGNPNYEYWHDNSLFEKIGLDLLIS